MTTNKKKIIKTYQENTVSDALAILNISKGTLYNYLRKIGAKLKGPHSKRKRKTKINLNN